MTDSFLKKLFSKKIQDNEDGKGQSGQAFLEFTLLMLSIVIISLIFTRSIDTGVGKLWLTIANKLAAPEKISFNN